MGMCCLKAIYLVGVIISESTCLFELSVLAFNVDWVFLAC